MGSGVASLMISVKNETMDFVKDCYNFAATFGYQFASLI